MKRPASCRSKADHHRPAPDTDGPCHCSTGERFGVHGKGGTAGAAKTGPSTMLQPAVSPAQPVGLSERGSLLRAGRRAAGPASRPETAPTPPARQNHARAEAVTPSGGQQQHHHHHHHHQDKHRGWQELLVLSLLPLLPLAALATCRKRRSCGGAAAKGEGGPRLLEDCGDFFGLRREHRISAQQPTAASRIQ